MNKNDTATVVEVTILGERLSELRARIEAADYSPRPNRRARRAAAARARRAHRAEVRAESALRERLARARGPR